MVKAKKPKPKICRICKSKFSPSKSTQIICSLSCALQYGKSQAAKQAERKAIAERKAHRQKKADLKPLKDWEDMTQRVVNDYIRQRDEHLPCISCGTWDTVQWEAGHFRSRGAASHLRYFEDNISKQCHRCNVQLSGNQQQYRINLIAKIGPERVEALESNNEPQRYTREELETLRAHYRQKTRELIRQREGV